MDRFARALFEELAPLVVDDSGSAANKRKVMLACESAVNGIEESVDFVGRPDATLFAEVRDCIAPAERDAAEKIIRHHLRRASVHFSRRDHLTLARG